jgi:hypothetical protein
VIFYPSCNTFGVEIFCILVARANPWISRFKSPYSFYFWVETRQLMSSLYIISGLIIHILYFELNLFNSPFAPFDYVLQLDHVHESLTHFIISILKCLIFYSHIQDVEPLGN